MNRVEFSDINKFFASIGLILIGLALFLPWIINQNSDLLFLDKENLNTLSPESIQIITKQQNYLLFLSNSLSWLIPVLFLLGFFLLCYGLWQWKKRQKVIDQIQDLDLKAKQHQNLTLEDRKEIKEEELMEAKPEDIKTEVDKYIAIENKIYKKLLPYYRVNYETISNIRIGLYNYDIILKSRYIKVRADLILEVKYYKTQLIYNRLFDATMQFFQAINHYENNLQRRAIPILIFVYETDGEKEKISEYKEKLIAYSQEMGKKIRVKFFKESELDSVEHSDLLADN
jgi:hypothetical protein